jgi:two-component system, cell cycle sensor histidine kinase and response regulator CckA
MPLVRAAAFRDWGGYARQALPRGMGFAMGGYLTTASFLRAAWAWAAVSLVSTPAAAADMPLSPLALTGWALAGALAVMCAAIGAMYLFRCRTGSTDHVAGHMQLQALDALRTGTAICGANGARLWSNAAWRHHVGSADGGGDVAGVIERLLADGDTGRDALRGLREAAARRSPCAAELRLRGPDAAPAWRRVEVTPLSGPDRSLIWTVEECDPPHDAGRVRRTDEDIVAAFFDEAPVGFFSVDGDGRFVTVNDTFARWLGRDRAALISGGVRIAEVIADGAVPGAPAHAPFARDGDETRGDAVFLGAEGRRFEAAIVQRVVRERGGELYTRALVRDLSGERERAEALHQAEERFHRFFDEAPVGIVLVDAKGIITECSMAFAEMIGTGGGTVIGRNLAACAVPEDRDRVGRWLAGAMASEEAPSLQAKLSGEQGVNASLFARRMMDDEGNCVGLMVHALDQTEQRNLETQFFQSQKMDLVGKLAGGIAHDFNNLLTAMIGFCDLLLQRHSPKDQSFADIMQIKQNANRAANLVRQLLAFSRQQTLQPRVLDLTDILAELSHLLRRLIGANIALDMVHGRDLGLIKADQSQLEQVIINLAVNARDAIGGDGGKLTVRTRAVMAVGLPRLPHGPLPVGDYVVLEVQDSGCGISRENLDRIFEPFFTTKEVGSGTGLGLSTVYGIVKQTGGHIFVDSAPGQGAKFTIYLPRVAAVAGEAAAEVEEAKADATRDLTGAGTVMLVEDEDAVRMFGARALRNKGYTVVEAPSGEEALRLLGEQGDAIDVLITDVVMPGMDGPTMIRRVRESHPDMKVIFISGYTEDSFRQRLDETVDIHFLPKPFTLQQLAGKVKEIMVGDGEAAA